MTEKSSEQQLANQARIALLEGITRAAEAGNGETARAFAEAYAIFRKEAPGDSENDDRVVTSYSDRRLDGRR
ncbi:hypothetical protein V2J94_41410 [Streptomyces sp. DSM 41524]|uniref:Uncharacterized protein n=1 Tax=Streptomyces asiaticus subsp. ignotus TaxID=3098222 RepID=A0ABU7QA00_9ACTN|nr:hypothetical protein [Streptomyces sp. DSM 41524]